MVDVPVVLVWLVFLVVVWTALKQVRRDRQKRFRLFRDRLDQLHASIPPFDDSEVERHGNRVFVDKLVIRRLAFKKH